MSAVDARSAVAIGGGTGLPLVLRCLSVSGYDLTAIVTMADDGGSSGWLRRELGVLPPGDARNCLVALSEGDPVLADLFQYRFKTGEGLAGHALGNLIIAALADMMDDFPSALDAAGALLVSGGRVLPSTVQDVVLVGENIEGEVVTGQARVARSAAPVRKVCLEPGDPPAYAPALEAISSADLVVIGPGSLYTSLIPNFLVARVADAVRRTAGTVVYVCNVANQRGETAGMNAEDHLRALFEYGLEGAIDVVVVHDTDMGPECAGIDPVDGGAAVRERLATLVPRIVAGNLMDCENPMHHDPAALCALLREV